MSDQPKFRFVLPPSLGPERAASCAAALQGFLAPKIDGELEVVVADDYAAIEAHILSGGADAAWAPPFVCARLQRAGGRFLLHAVRQGASRYRAGLVCRAGEAPALHDLKAAFGERRAVWVNPDSTAGYLLPRQWLRDRGLHIEQAFKSTAFAGSYQDAVAQLLSDEADITSVFASVEDSEGGYSALDSLPEVDQAKLEIFAYTAERLNDGIVFSPDCDRLELESIRDALRDAHDSAEGRQAIKDTFNAERFVATEAAAYSAAYGDGPDATDKGDDDSSDNAEDAGGESGES